MKRVLELIGQIETAAELLIAPRIRDACRELREELDKPAVLWPEGVMEAVAEYVSPSVYNPESRTFKSLDKRIAWAVSVWQERHGPMTDDQRQYMADILIWALRTTSKEAGEDKRKLYSFALTAISSLVNDDRVAAGFKRRAVKQADVSDMLAGVAA